MARGRRASHEREEITLFAAALTKDRVEVLMRLSGIALFALAIACSSATAPTVLGEWGGKEASLSLTSSGGTVSYLCGAGTIDSAWIISPDGQFTASGWHYFGGGPVPPGGTTPHPARYSAQVDGQFLTMTVLVSDLQQTLGPFHLIRGGAAVHELCV